MSGNILSHVQRIFGGPAPQQVQQPAQQQVPMSNNPAQNPTPQQPAASAQTAPNGVIPANGAEKPDPLKQHEKLWEPPAADPNAPKPTVMPTPQEIMAATAKVDFKQIMDPALLEKVKAGGEDAAAAMAELMNKAAQAAYGQSAVAAQKMVETAVRQKTEEFNSSIPVLLKKQNTREQLFQENKGFSNPVVAPVVEAITMQLTEKFPKASQAELVQMAKEILTGTANVLNPAPEKQPTEADKRKAAAEDWSAYLADPSPFSQ